MSVNPVLLQKALRENRADLEDFTKELKKWGDDMKRKEESVTNANNNNTPSNKVRKVAKSTKKKTPKKPATKIGSTDYAAWEKFDVDAELEKLEEAEDEESELTDECNEKIYDEAIIEKEKGNKFVKNQKWDEAIECYTKAINCYSYDPIFYANRGLCYLKKNLFVQAERDCSLSLKLDTTYVKAYQRRAAANTGLNKLEHAEADLLKVLELEPKNKESRIELEKLRQRLKKTEKPPEQRPVSKFTASRSKAGCSKIVNLENKSVDNFKPDSVWSLEDDIILVKPINKPPHLRSTKPLKRIKIVETELELIAKQEDAIKKHVSERTQPQGDFNQPKIEEKTSETVQDPVKIVSSFKEKQIKKTSTCPLITEIKNTSKSVLSKDLENNKFIMPKSSVQFNLAWKNLKETQQKYKYLRDIDPQAIPKIFLNSLENNIFSNILEVLAKHSVENKDNIWDILESFTLVKRFSTLTMFMSHDDKKNLWRIIDYMKENGEINKERVDELIQKYEL